MHVSVEQSFRFCTDLPLQVSALVRVCKHWAKHWLSIGARYGVLSNQAIEFLLWYFMNEAFDTIENGVKRAKLCAIRDVLVHTSGCSSTSNLIVLVFLSSKENHSMHQNCTPKPQCTSLTLRTVSTPVFTSLLMP